MVIFTAAKQRWDLILDKQNEIFLDQFREQLSQLKSLLEHPGDIYLGRLQSGNNSMKFHSFLRRRSPINTGIQVSFAPSRHHRELRT